MDRVFVSVGDGAGARRRQGAAPGPRQGRTWWEVMHPEGSEGTWRDLPGLLGDSMRLVWTSGRNIFLLTSGLQLLAALGVAVQLFVAKAVFDAVLGTGGNAELADVGPTLVALVAVTVALDLARAIRDEQGRVLGELVGRKAIDRVLDVSTRIDLLAFESPEFNDRLQRARAQGQFRALQTVNGLLGIVGSLVTATAIVFALAALQPLLLPFVLIGYLPLWVVASLNTRDLYHYTRGMTPNDRQRGYLQNVLMGRNAAKEVRAFNLAGFVGRRYDTLYDERIAELRKLAKRRTARALLGSVTSSAVTVGTIAMLAWLYTSDRMSLAAAGAAVFGLYQLANQLRRAVAVIFQDFERYLLPARENVGLGRKERIEDLNAIFEAAARADAHEFLASLPEGYETMLGREFSGGFDLSIGQWQRVALARAFFRDAPFVILDEPTASLDARAESNLFERMRELLHGRSVVLISHRFSSVRSADRIYVLHEGRVVEEGSHEELMERDGLYAELFTLQARAYVDRPAAVGGGDEAGGRGGAGEAGGAGGRGANGPP